MLRLLRIACAVVALTVVVGPTSGGAVPCTPEAATSWTEVGHGFFKLRGLIRSQGVTSDGDSWFFSWQGGISRTDKNYLERAITPIPPQLLVDNPSIKPDRTNHIGQNHVGDLDVYNGVVYAPIEDGDENLELITVNDPDFQYPYIALFDAKTLLYTGVKYRLPLDIHRDGVPWVAVNGPANEVYTAEWNNPTDRIFVWDLQMRFKRFITLQYPVELGAGFRLNRIQGAKFRAGKLYASRDDDAKSVFSIDVETGAVKKLFSMNPGVESESEGIAIRETDDGAWLHVVLVVHNLNPNDDPEFWKTHIELRHFAPRCG
jgi:hypothetical protein